ncbi:MAG: NAD-dependent epimerase/dehydratase family protein [Rhodospirillaceae bacterium]|nr:NAD-dependent epimerase/dehydratase family protein [Rhodospirillaceae bacterium]MBT5912864.1 NAD-dependent epimerase/dehydratase family protein [Rhodospirillaceae bacterium]MBT6305633.1 NAD-dependent epimerase/dehydratase family protein [Rhodospirillaceae bacterium]MDC0999351.1 NAD-dependent epimerase/dehydratase family protein [Alphaproteobacteria bacterium]
MSKTICVAGASGLVGSNIVREALSRGYQVNGTMRNVTTQERTKYLQRLKCSENLKLFSADMLVTGTFNDALSGVDAVFITCLIPTYRGPTGVLAREMDYEQGYREIVKPTVDGCLEILRSAHDEGIKKVIICSSTSSTNPIPSVSNKNEVDHWSDENEQFKAQKFTSATKTVLEKAALEFANQNKIRLSIILPTGLYGEAILPEHLNHNPFAWLKRIIEGDAPRHDITPNDSASMIHLDDLANLFLAAYENPTARGRYFGVLDSFHWRDIYSECQKILPNMRMPKPLQEKPILSTSFDFSRRDSLGVHIRDFPTLLRQTIEWLQSNPFTNDIQ